MRALAHPDPVIDSALTHGLIPSTQAFPFATMALEGENRRSQGQRTPPFCAGAVFCREFADSFRGMSPTCLMKNERKGFYMNSIIDAITPEDFGSPMDSRLFEEWRQAKKAHLSAARQMIAFYLVGLAGLILLGGLVGLILFFGLAIVGICVGMPKKKKLNALQKQLGLDDRAVNQVVAGKRRGA